MWWLQPKFFFMRAIETVHVFFFRYQTLLFFSSPSFSMRRRHVPLLVNDARNRSTDDDSRKLTRKSPCSWWTRWLKQTLRLRRTSPCMEGPKKMPWDFDVGVYLWHGRNRPCPIWVRAPRPTLPWQPMWDIPFPFKRLHDIAAGTNQPILVTFYPCL